MLYNDSDVYKVLEGVAYTLADKRDADLEKRADAIIDLIAAAQQPDGYLDTYYTLVEPQNRWKNDQYGHELYCAGHLIEAAVAYQQATGKHKLLDVARKLADHIDSFSAPTSGTRPAATRRSSWPSSSSTGPPRRNATSNWRCSSSTSAARRTAASCSASTPRT